MLNLVQSRSRNLRTQFTEALTRRFEVRLARNAREIMEAQRLRYEVYFWELGAKISTQHFGHDADYFDPFCDHFIAIDMLHGDIVGTYRMLTPQGAARAGRLYLEESFDVRPLASIRPKLAEIGRACIKREVRNTNVLPHLWSEIARHLRAQNLRYLIGSASIPTTKGLASAYAVFDALDPASFAPPALRINPFEPITTSKVEPVRLVEMPPLLRGYLQLGACIAGAPAHDPQFGCIDIPVLLDIEAANTRLAMRVLKQ